jgi:hypothetical protein
MAQSSKAASTIPMEKYDKLGIRRRAYQVVGVVTLQGAGAARRAGPGVIAQRSGCGDDCRSATANPAVRTLGGPPS